MKWLALAILFSLQSAYGEDAKLERNKKAVLDFYDKALNQKDFDAASQHFGATYLQHNPLAADGDYVILHVHAVREPGARGAAIVDIFRLDSNGKIVEHWDVVQPVPEKAANNNTMF